MGFLFLVFLFCCPLRQGRLCCQPPQSLPRLALTVRLRVPERPGWGGGGRSTLGGGVGEALAEFCWQAPAPVQGPLLLS